MKRSQRASDNCPTICKRFVLHEVAPSAVFTNCSKDHGATQMLCFTQVVAERSLSTAVLKEDSSESVYILQGISALDGSYSSIVLR